MVEECPIERCESRLIALEKQHFELTEEQIDKIADRAAKKALMTVYADVGQSVIKRLAWLVGILIVSGLIYLAGKDALLK
jgi:hypothetical protein